MELRKLERLVARFLDGTLSKEEQAHVNRLLPKSSTLRQVLVKELAARALMDLVPGTLPPPSSSVDPQLN